MPNDLGILARSALVMMLLAAGCAAQGGSLDPAARAGMDRGNRAWIEGMKRGDAEMIAATYAEDAVDCSPAGECIKGRIAIGQLLREIMAKLGRAESASVTTKGSVEQGGLVYEWGEAEASFASGNHVAGRYLTVWRKRTGGGWEIFRNVRLPAGEKQ